MAPSAENINISAMSMVCIESSYSADLSFDRSLGNMPVYSSHLLRYDELKLGDRIREARQQQGITLRELADKLDTSSARLSQIENDRLRLDLHEVLAFAAALNVPLDALVPADAAL